MGGNPQYTMRSSWFQRLGEAVERAREAASGMATTLSDEEVKRRRQAVAGVGASWEEYPLTLGPGERIQDLIHEGRKY